MHTLEKEHSIPAPNPPWMLNLSNDAVYTHEPDVSLVGISEHAKGSATQEHR